ncbi:phosphotransferase family protein [Streptomyces sp. NPDC088789]|uniref:phosphotransferase family protein n=1 Tax=Streptomyces sp. NPDC088789 TaxID=3365899 RepID=UPI003802C1B7
MDGVEVVRYLLDSGLLSSQAVVDGRVTVREESRRNSNHAVLVDDGPGYLVKQGATRDGRITVDHEAEVYQYLTNTTAAAHLPRMIHCDRSRHLVVLELLADAVDLRRWHTRTRRPPVSLAAGAGVALATLHSCAAKAGGSAIPGLPPAVDTRPWTLTMHRPHARTAWHLSGATLDLIARLQDDQHACDRLDDLARNWCDDALIHGDLRWDNILGHRPGGHGQLKATLVDLELAGSGDARWDVGSFLGEHLACWLLSIPLAGNAPPERYLDLAQRPLRLMHPAIAAFWRAYRRTACVADNATNQWLRTAVSYAGVRLLHLALEEAQHTPQTTPAIICLFRVAVNVLTRPDHARTDLLGLTTAQGTA